MWTNDQSGHRGFGTAGIHLLIRIFDIDIIGDDLHQTPFSQVQAVELVASRERWPCDDSSFASSLAPPIGGLDPLALT
jgi:hypothetical protein